MQKKVRIAYSFLRGVFVIMLALSSEAFGSDISAYPGLLNLEAYGSGYLSSSHSPIPAVTRNSQLATFAALQFADMLQTVQFLGVTEVRHYTTRQSSVSVVNVGNVMENGQVDTEKLQGNDACTIDGWGNGVCWRTTWHTTQRSYSVHKYHEANPLLGERPSASRLIGFSAVGFCVVAAVTHYLPPQWATILSDSLVSSMAINVEGNTALTSPGLFTDWKRGPVPIVVSLRW